MPYEFLWTDEIIAHLAEHDVRQDEVEHVVSNPRTCLLIAKRNIPPELIEALRRNREKIANELPELRERGIRLDEAASENSLSGHLRRAIHHSGRPLKRIADEAGLDAFQLCDFLEGTRTLRSDVLDRLAQAVGATIHLDPARLIRPEMPSHESRPA